MLEAVYIFQPICRLTFKIGDVFAARISETEGFAGLQKCGGAKYRRGRKPERCFAEPKNAEQAFLR